MSTTENTTTDLTKASTNTTEPSETTAVPSQGSGAASEASPISKEPTTDEGYLPATYFNEPLFQEDNTGTRKYKSLLRGLKTIINREYDPSENPDLMPGQLARFYEDLNGNYNELFLSTPSESIAFIYKSLGCSYSLQPALKAERVEEPAIPALKTEGWIMWSTIQMLLGPDEHAGFLMRAVKKWDVVDPETDKVFPNTIPRESFPLKADTRMCDWYEGVSERLKKEADEEAEERERQRQMEQHAQNHRKLLGRQDDEDSVDSRGPALAYFRNPLYRHGDGRPSIVRYDVRPIDTRPPDARPGAVRRSSRPPLSPRPSMLDRGKEAASTVGHVIRNVASPHLWDGNGSSNSSRERRRRSGSDHRHHAPGDPPPQGEPYDDRLPGQGSPRLRRQQRPARPGSSPDDSWDGDERPPRQNELLRPRKDDREHSLRHSRSHEPTPSQREYGDNYFAQGEPQDNSEGVDTRRRPSLGPSFAPSADLPFAAQVAQQRPPRDDRPPRRPPPDRDDQGPYSPMDTLDRYEPERNEPARHRARSRYSDRGDRPRLNDRPDDRVRFNEPRRDNRSRFNDRPEDDPSRYDDRPSEERLRYDDRPRDDSMRYDDRPADERARYDDRPPRERPRFDDKPRHDDQRDRDSGDRRRDYDSPQRRRVSDTPSRRSASARRSNASDFDSGYSGPDDRDKRAGGRKQARFAPTSISGVDGRRYVDQLPWQG